MKFWKSWGGYTLHTTPMSQWSIKLFSSYHPEMNLMEEEKTFTKRIMEVLWNTLMTKTLVLEVWIVFAKYSQNLENIIKTEKKIVLPSRNLPFIYVDGALNQLA